MPDEYDIDFFNNSPQIQQRRSSTLSGEQHPDCAHCWESENAAYLVTAHNKISGKTLVV